MVLDDVILFKHADPGAQIVQDPLDTVTDPENCFEYKKNYLNLKFSVVDEITDPDPAPF